METGGAFHKMAHQGVLFCPQTLRSRLAFSTVKVHFNLSDPVRIIQSHQHQTQNVSLIVTPFVRHKALFSVVDIKLRLVNASCQQIWLCLIFLRDCASKYVARWTSYCCSMFSAGSDRRGSNTLHRCPEKQTSLISWDWDTDEKYASFWLIDVNQ